MMYGVNVEDDDFMDNAMERHDLGGDQTLKGRRNSLDALNVNLKSQKNKKKKVLPVPKDPSSPTEDSPVN